MLSDDVKHCAACGTPVSAAEAVLYDFRLYCPACFDRRRGKADSPEPRLGGRPRADRRPDGPSQSRVQTP